MKRNDQEKKDYSKKIAAGASLFLVLALLTTSSLAFKDVEQYKENKFRSLGPEYNVVLVEDFQNNDNWKQGEEIRKVVYVQNGQESDREGQNADYVYVRLKLSEYMGIQGKIYDYTKDTYMIDKDGEFIRVKYDPENSENSENSEKKEAIIKKFKELGVEIDLSEFESRVEQLPNALDSDGDEYYYVKNKEGDPNGQWGKKIIKKIEGDGKEVSLADPNAENAEKVFTPVLWNWYPDYHNTPVEDEGAYDKSNHFRNLVDLNLGENVITYTKWKEEAGEYGQPDPVKKWILDDTDIENGWVYWGEPLAPIQKTSSDEESTEDYKTSHLLESVTGVIIPEGLVDYTLKVEMQAYSREEFYNLEDWNEDIKYMLERAPLN